MIILVFLSKVTAYSELVNAPIKLLVLQRRLLLVINVPRPRYAMETTGS